MMEVKFYESAEDSLLKFAVILAKSAGQDGLRCERSFRKFRQKKIPRSSGENRIKRNTP